MANDAVPDDVSDLADSFVPRVARVQMSAADMRDTIEQAIMADRATRPSREDVPGPQQHEAWAALAKAAGAEVEETPIGTVTTFRRMDELIAFALKSQSPSPVAQETVKEAGTLTAYEIQVLIGTSISGCRMPPDTIFDLRAAWDHLYELGFIDRTDGLAIATDAGMRRIASMLAPASPSRPVEAVDPKLVRYVAMLRHQCAYNGPCADNSDGCTCTAEELNERHLRSKATSPSRPVEAVPVAWRWKTTGSELWYYGENGADAHWCSGSRKLVEPLYASPREPEGMDAATVEACAKAIEELAEHWKNRDGILPRPDGEWPAFMAKVVRRLAEPRP